MDRSTPGLPVHHQLSEFTQSHVHRVGDAIQPSHPLSLPSQSIWIRFYSFIAKYLQLPFYVLKSISPVRLFVTPRTVACQASPSLGFSKQEYWSGLPFPSPGDLPDPGIEPRSPALQADALPSEPPGKPFMY